MSRRLPIVVTRIGWILLGSTVALPVLLAVLGLALPSVTAFREPLTTWLAETLHQEVELRRAELRARGIDLRLVLHDLVLRDPVSEEAQLIAGELAVDLRLPASLLARAPRVTRIRIADARLALRRGTDGGLTIAGLERLARARPAARDFFLARGKLELDEATIAWPEAGDASPPQLTAVNARMINRGDHHRLALSARLPEPAAASGSHARLYADLRGAPEHPDRWGGISYLVGEDLELTPLSAGRLSRWPIQVRGRLSLAGRAHWAGGQLTEARVRIEAADLGLAATPVDADRLAAWLQWQRKADGWRLQIPGLVLDRGEDTWTGSGIDIQRNGQQLMATAASLDLALLAPAMLSALERRSDEPSAALWAELLAARPRGRLESVALRLSRRDSQGATPVDWQFRTWAAELETKAAGHIPGVTGLSGALVVGPAGGWIRFAARAPRLAVPELFPAPLPFTALAGELAWAQDSSGHVCLSAPLLLAESRDLRTLSAIRLDLPAGGEGPRLRLHTHFSDGNAAAIPRYLPTGAMPPTLVDWLDRAFPEGRIPAGALVFDGPLEAFPFDHSEGRFEVLLDVTDLTLAYQRDWPPLKQAHGRLRFLNRGLDIELSRGQILDTRVAPAIARIPALGRATRVAIRGRGDGPFADAFRLLRETPLAERHAHLADASSASGRARIELDLSLPIGRGAGPSMRAEVSWPDDGARIALKDTPLALDALDGTLQISTEGVHADPVAGKLWGEPVTLRITQAEVDNGRATRVTLDGRTPIGELERRFPSRAWSLAAGTMPWTADVRLAPGRPPDDAAPMAWQLQSDLRGLALKLPAPLGKGKDATRAFVLSGVGDPRHTTGQITARLGEIGATLELSPDGAKGTEVTRAAIALDDRPPPLPEATGITVTGSLPELDLPAWLAWWRQPATRSGPPPIALPPLRHADVRIERLQVGDAAVDGLAVEAEPRAGGWLLRLAADDLFGVLTLPEGASRAPATLALERLELAPMLHAAVAGTRARSHQDTPSGSGRILTDPHRMRPIKIAVEQLSWQGQTLGRLRASSQTGSRGLVVDPISLTGPLGQVRGTAHWVADPLRTEVALAGETADLGRLLSRLGHDSILDRAPTSASLSLEWPGDPMDLSAATVRGQLGLEIGPGQLLEVEPGLGRMLGVLNLAALQRRLALDFSDLYEKGFGFEQIDGELTIGGGLARIARLEILGPSGDIAIRGHADLLAETLDQVVTITPKVSSGVALASAVAGGPLVGAAVYVADQVAGGAVDKLSRYQYRVTGPWGEPVFQRLDRARLVPAADSSQAQDLGRDRARADTGPPQSPSDGSDQKPTNLFLDLP